MNREIKFRAFIDGKMVNAHPLPDGRAIIGFRDSGLNIHIPKGYEKISLITHQEVPLMQFTGLHDKNGKEIWEGDIVKCWYGFGKVIFHSGCFMVEWIDNKDTYMEFLFSRKGMYSRTNEEEFEVIGTIYENPELLNQQTP